jgi:hypothetical protein
LGFVLFILISRRIFLGGREQADPAFDLRRKPSGAQQGNCGLNPPIVGHGKRFYSLSPRAISSACAIASVREQDCADGGCIVCIAVSVGVGIDNRKHIRVLICNVGV